MRVSRFLGKSSFYVERLQTYIAKLNFLMIFYLFIKGSGIDWWWFLALIPGSIFVVWFDKRFVLPNYLAEYMHQNPEWKKLTEVKRGRS